MSEPRKVHGVATALLNQLRAYRAGAVVRSCENKKRYADEYAARAAGIGVMTLNPQNPQLFIYSCKNCRGWHLTRSERPAYFAVDYLEKEAYK